MSAIGCYSMLFVSDKQNVKPTTGGNLNMLEIGNMKVYETSEAAEKMGYNIQTVRKLLRENRLKGKRLANKWVVTEKSIQEYFETEN